MGYLFRVTREHFKEPVTFYTVNWFCGCAHVVQIHQAVYVWAATSLYVYFISIFKKCLTHSPMSPAFNAFNICNYHIFMIYLSTRKLNKQYWSTSSSLVSITEKKFVVGLFTSGRVCFLELWLNHTESNHLDSKEQKACRLLRGIADTVP